MFETNDCQSRLKYEAICYRLRNKATGRNEVANNQRSYAFTNGWLNFDNLPEGEYELYASQHNTPKQSGVLDFGVTALASSTPLEWSHSTQ
jgi:hypothetical protein